MNLNITTILLNPLVGKILFLIFLGGYVIFSFVVYIQVKVMNKIVTHSWISAFLQTTALLFILIGLFLFVSVLVVL